MKHESEVLGHSLVGSGARKVIVLNDWMCDTSTWDSARPYLDGERFSWAFADLRGYGRSRGRAGAFTVTESAEDVLSLARALGWSRFAMVGHSMSALIAIHLAQHEPGRVERVVLLTPPPVRGFGGDDAALEGARALARADDPTRAALLAPRFADRLSPGWAAHKVARWGATSDRQAAVGYVTTFVRDGVPDPTVLVTVPMLVLTGERDIGAMPRDAVLRDLSPLCTDLQVIGLADVGHYPMQEMPPMTVACLERFLAASVV